MTGRYRPVLTLCALLALSGCSSLGTTKVDRLADLPIAITPPTDTPVPIHDMDAIEARYRRALQVAEDPALQRTIQMRLADLAMARSELAQQESAQVGTFFTEPIALYQQLLEASLPQSDAERVYYQLAKALALDGRMDEADAALAGLIVQYPDASFSAEAHFRRAQSAFSRGDYMAAEQHYHGALRSGEPAFEENALYMRGWSLFKQADYFPALISFTELLDQLLNDVREPMGVEPALRGMSVGQRQVLDDTLRAMGLAFTHLDGAEGIVELTDSIGPRAYEYLFYTQLGQAYREQERYRDSATAYARFVELNPNSELAPLFSVREIDTYLEGDFPSLVVPAKQDYVRRYGLHSDYWRLRDGELSTAARTHLHQYLGELARHQHARAQRYGVQGQSLQESASRRQAYRAAADWYREFVQTFPADAEVANMRFLLAEALTEADDLFEALDAYEQVAYTDAPSEHSAEAAYAAVLLSRELADRAALDVERSEERASRQEHAIDNALRFAQHHPRDPRASAALAYTAQHLLQLNQPERAAQVAEQLLELEPAAPGEERFSSWLVLGHSRFDLAQYAEAEQAYWRALELWSDYGPAEDLEGENQLRQSAVRERIAASLYERAQLAQKENDYDSAIALFLASADSAPDSAVAISARYDAGHYLMLSERWSEAEQVLVAFRRDFPEHPLTAGLPARLAILYQTQEQWDRAADELLLLESGSDDPALRRTSLYLAAELYERAGLSNQAIDTYRRYAHNYAEPLAEQMEAQYRLSHLYAQNQDTERRHYWLQKLVDRHEGAGSAQSGRSTYLAAYGASELAEASFEEFISVPLRLPLQQSLTQKRAALERALQEQQAVAAYGVAEFATRASHRMGAIYHQLSQDLMDSERPQGLSLLELEQYDILLEEQAFPFEERAIEIYEHNARRSWNGVYDQWVERSFRALAEILPARYGKQEARVEVSRGIH